MSCEVVVLEESLTAYAVTGLDGQLDAGLSSFDLNKALDTGNDIGNAAEAGMPLVAGNPVVLPTPDARVLRWPCRLFRFAIPAGSVVMNLETDGMAVNHAYVVEESDSLLTLGPQREELLTMAGRLLDVTQDEQVAMSELAEETEPNTIAMKAMRSIAQARGRDNGTAVMNLMWTNAGVWARHPVGNAALAVSCRDLLSDEERGIYYELLYRPWREVMGENDAQ
jgi:hypothetical protein